MSTVTSREVIARQAQAAAQRHAAGAPVPPNPYCPILEADHHREWAASFKRACNELVAEAEGSA
jgi:hypothetical protein